jgi:hypothetical protein
MATLCFVRDHRRSLLALGVALAISGATGAAQAEPDAAASHEKNAQVAYALQDWSTAIREFEAGFQSEQRPDFLWGIAQAQRLSGDCKAAIISYKSYRRTEISAEQSAAADSRIQHCEQELKAQAAAAQAAAAPAPPPHAPVAAPVVVAKAETATPPADVPPERARHFYSDALGDTLFLTGVAAGGVGTYFLLAGNAAMNGAKSAPYASYASDTHSAYREQIAGVATLAAGGLFFACGLVRYLTLSASSSGRSAALGLSPLGFDLRGRF